MIDLAFIASTPHLHDVSAAGSIDMALTHLVHADPAQAAYFADRSRGGGRVYLDNSAYEMRAITGRGLDAGAVFAAARLINPSVIVCQDVLYDGPATVRTTRAFLTQAADETEPGQYTYLAVPQGTSRVEWLACYEALRELAGIGMIGLSKLSVPRCFDAPVAEARLTCVAALADRTTPPPPLHLLGGDRSLVWELRRHHAYGHDTWIRSNDSSFAYWYAACDVPAGAYTGRAPHDVAREPDLVDRTLTPAQTQAAHRHIALLREAAGLASVPVPTTWWTR